MNHRQPKLTYRENEGLIINGVWDGTEPLNEGGIGLHGGRWALRDRNFSIGSTGFFLEIDFLHE